MAVPLAFTDEVDTKENIPLLPSKNNPNPIAHPFTFTDEINDDDDSKGKFPMLPSETSSKKRRKRNRKRKKKVPITDFKYRQEDLSASSSQVQPPQPAPPEPTAAPATRTLPKSLIKPKVPTSLEEVVSMYSKIPDTMEDDRDLLEVVAMKGMHFNMPSWWRPGGYDDDD